MKKTYFLGATLLSVLLIGAGCGSAATSSNSATPSATAPAPAASFIDTVATKLAAANIASTKADLGPKLGAMGITANVKTAAKFKVAGEAANIEVFVLDLNSAADGATVKAALEKNFAAVKQVSDKYQTKILAIGGDTAVVGLAYHSDDSVKGAAVEAALAK